MTKLRFDSETGNFWQDLCQEHLQLIIDTGNEAFSARAYQEMTRRHELAMAESAATEEQPEAIELDTDYDALDELVRFGSVAQGIPVCGKTQITAAQAAILLSIKIVLKTS